MKSSVDRDRACRAKVASVSRSKKPKQIEKPMDLPNPLIVDEDAFNRLLDKMIESPPVPLEEVRRRRKNPETDPRYLPVFHFSQRLTPDQMADMERQKELLRRERKRRTKAQ